MRIGYLGPIGTFSEEAAVQYTKHEHIKDPVFIPFPDLLAVGDAVLEQQIDIGILPVENALDGQVNSVNDMLISTAKLCGCGEVVLPVRIHLVGKKDVTPEKCTRIYSHPQPFGQCVQFLRTYYPLCQQFASTSTSQAVADMLASPEPALSLSNERAATYHGATIVQYNVHDGMENETRFLAIGLAHHAPTANDKTSICFTLPSADHPGALYLALQPFEKAGINLTRIQSRPTKDGLGKYVFLLDMEGHCSDSMIADTLEQLQRLTCTFRIIGSYPAWK